LRVQLTQLNELSRWYSSQLWQIPFAFLTLAAGILGIVIDKGATAVIMALFNSLYYRRIHYLANVIVGL